MTRRRLAALVGLIAMAMLLVGVPAQGKAPLHGTMDLQYDLLWAGPSATAPDWVGTITIDDQVYDMAFFNTGSGKSFTEHPGKNIFFEETWVIYEHDTLDYEFDGGVLTSFDDDDAVVVLSGYDRGVTVLANGTWRMNGTVDEATGDFAEWLGRRVHMMGALDFRADGLFGPGTFRIN